jgi:dienelactone hydrolase
MATVVTRTFEVEGVDGGPLRGDVRTAGDGTDRPAVVICHGFKGFKDWGFFPRIADRLAHAGMTSVSFNFSGSGVGPEGDRFSEPERFRRATVSGDLTDLGTVWDRLLDGSLADGLGAPTAAGVLGHSRGGGTAILFAADREDCGALVTWNAISTVDRWDAATIAGWREDGSLPIVNGRTGEVLPLGTDYLDDVDRYGAGRLAIAQAAARVRAPWLILHGASDETVSAAEGALLAEHAGPDATHVVVPAGTHTFGAQHPWAGSTPELDRVFEESVAWLVGALL